MQAKALDSKLALPLLGLAQMHLLQKDGCNTAIGFLETALGLSGNWLDALQVSLSRPPCFTVPLTVWGIGILLGGSGCRCHCNNIVGQQSSDEMHKRAAKWRPHCHPCRPALRSLLMIDPCSAGHSLKRSCSLRDCEACLCGSRQEMQCCADPACACCVQLLSILYPHATGRKAEAALQQLTAGAQRGNADASLWEAVGELSSSSDPAGACPKRLRVPRRILCCILSEGLSHGCNELFGRTTWHATLIECGACVSAEALKAYSTSLELHRKAHAERLAAAARRAKRAQSQGTLLENGHAEGSTLPQPEQPEAVEAVPAKLLNNAAVLHMRNGRTDEALALMEEATQARLGCDTPHRHCMLHGTRWLSSPHFWSWQPSPSSIGLDPGLVLACSILALLTAAFGVCICMGKLILTAHSDLGLHPCCSPLRLLLQSVQAPGGAASLPEGSQVTLGFNLARVREASGQLQAAAREYKSILDQFPGYLACHQRLAAIAQKRGDFAGAEQRLSEALKGNPDDADTLAALGGTHLLRHLQDSTCGRMGCACSTSCRRSACAILPAA
ncbi:hypothetical protein MMC29_000011 [Sticta canariensis]|nr:hypothetical protein [Sticta canariensis]